MERAADSFSRVAEHAGTKNILVNMENDNPVSEDPFFIGADQSAIRMRSSGRLFLGVNDDFLKDNTGSFRVMVYY